MKFLLIPAIAITFLLSCSNTEIGKEKDVDPDAVFYDYKIWAEEGMEEITVVLQYRFGGENGTTLVLERPSKVTFDGTELHIDSAKLTGVFYELSKPAAEFNGRHTIVFTDKTGKDHKEEFEFAPFTLAADLPEKIKKEPFVIRLNGLSVMPATVRLVMTDTAFATKDVNEEIQIKNGDLNITTWMWQELKSGPISLEIFREEEKPLKNASKEGGRLIMTYKLRREFEATD